VEKIRSFDGLVLEELEAQTLDLLPDREEMTFLPSYNNWYSFNKVDQTNYADQKAWANADKGGLAVAANGAQQLNANHIGPSK
jgi:hypothetical protein